MAATAESAGEISHEEQAAAVGRALAHPARIRIVCLLLDKEQCIGGDIVDEIGLAQSTVSQHLRVLKSAGLVVGEIERPRTCYSLNPDALVPLAELFNTIFEKDRQGRLRGRACHVPEGRRR